MKLISLNIKAILILIGFIVSQHKVISADSAAGVWTATDKKNKSITIRLTDDHIAFSNYTNSDKGALGEQGVWRMDGEDIMIVYASGWVDLISKKGTTYTKKAFKNGTPISGKPDIVAQVKKTGDNVNWLKVKTSEFIGVWKLKDESNKDFYLRVDVDFTAQTNYAKGRTGVFGENGIWRQEGDRIVITYNSGWIDVIVSHDGKFSKFGYSPDQPKIGKPNNMGKAIKIDPAEAGIK